MLGGICCSLHHLYILPQDEAIEGNIMMIQIPKSGACHLNWTDPKGTQSHGSLYW
jgi:hypothetical protein